MRPRPRVVGLDDALDAVDHARGREVRARHELDQVRDRERRVRQQREARVDDLAQIVRRDVRRHADRDTGAAVDEQVRDPRGQHGRLALALVVVRREIDRLLVDVGQQLLRDAGHAHFGVAHGRRRIAVDRAEVALAVDEQVAHRERLRHPDDRVVDRDVAVRMVLTDDVADDAGRLLVRSIPLVAELAHRVQDAPMHRFQAVPNVRQRATHDYAHRVIEVRLPHLVFEIDGEDFFTYGHRLRSKNYPAPCPHALRSRDESSTRCKCGRVTLKTRKRRFRSTPTTHPSAQKTRRKSNTCESLAVAFASTRKAILARLSRPRDTTLRCSQSTL